MAPNETDSWTLLLSHLAERNGTSDLARRRSREPLLSAWHGSTKQQRGFLCREPPFLISELCSDDRYTCVSVYDVGRAAVFICCYIAEGDQMIGPAMAH